MASIFLLIQMMPIFSLSVLHTMDVASPDVRAHMHRRLACVDEDIMCELNARVFEYLCQRVESL